MSYITVADIQDSIAEGIDLTNYILESDGEIEDVAEQVGVRDADDIETDPLHYKVRRFAVVYVLMRMCQDKVGVSNLENPQANKYLIGYEMYRAQLKELRSQITASMVTGDVDEIRDRANTQMGGLFRS